MGLLDGKVGLVVGVANERSYAWHIANEIVAQGGQCAYSHIPGEKNGRRTQRATEKIAPNPVLYECDAGSDEAIVKLFEDYAKDHDRLDFLIHSIAYADRDWLQIGKFADTPRKAFLEAMDISAYTLLAMSAQARPLMAKNGGGSIMAMSYYGAQKVILGYNVMAVAKSCLETSTRYLAAELGVDNIRVNTISGGYLRTLASSAVGGTDDLEERAAQVAPLRRTTAGSDVGKTAVYLASDLSSGVTGENLFVDCGVNIIGA